MPTTKTLTDSLELLLKIFAVLGVFWAGGAWCLRRYRRWREGQVLRILKRLEHNESIGVDSFTSELIGDVVGDVPAFAQGNQFPMRLRLRHRWRMLFVPSGKTIIRTIDRLEEAEKVERSFTGNHRHIKRQQSGRGL